MSVDSRSPASLKVAPENVVEAAKWNGQAGRRWIRHCDETDHHFEPFGRAALGRINIRCDDRILDVGCGCGGSTLQLLSGPLLPRTVSAIDLSSGMIERAQQRAASAAPIAFVTGDIVTQQFKTQFDVVYSRFGLNFFGNLVRAFSKLRSLLLPGGRLVFVCWRGLEHNPWLATGDPKTTEGQGLFSLADRSMLASVLRDGGFEKPIIEQHDHPIHLTGASAQHWLRVTWPEVRDLYYSRNAAQAISLPASTWVVQATR